MPSKEEIKAKLCIDNATPSYPVRELVDWIEQQHNREVLRHLEQIQQELYEADLAWRQAAHDTTDETIRVSRWRFYCTQVKAYYEGVVFWQ